ncbi:MAG TPA: CUAEP/CCAEP-tail radical SAM protein [Vicinamibacterales bacterium]|nr:CUAEP/CCAEP-tail radical SAM protein [Vicinamibacterales bacterium]
MVVLVSTYDLGRQPFGVASPAAWLRRAGVEARAIDLSRERLSPDTVTAARVVAFYLPMHTATRLALPVIDRVRSINPDATLCAYGLYAQLNETLLREHGVTTILGPEAEEELVDLVRRGRTEVRPLRTLPRLHFIQPDRTSLPSLDKYATLVMPDGTRKIVGSTEATRGCKHRCRHCPIVPVYNGQFRVVPVDVVIADVRAQVERGATHITFGDPDFFNGPTHARKIVDALHQEFPHVTYDVTIKIEHLLAHRELLPLLVKTGCAFVTSAVESVDDAVLEKLEKGHTRAGFIEAATLCRHAQLTLVPTFVAFTPWTTLQSYMDLVNVVDDLGLTGHVAPVQWGIRLLVTFNSRLLELADIQRVIGPFDPKTLTYPWTHDDPRVDALQQQMMALAGQPRRARSTVPYLDEPWYC